MKKTLVCCGKHRTFADKKRFCGITTTCVCVCCNCIHCSTLVHASLVLLPILGVGWVLGFFVVGEGAIFTVIEWLFSIFTTLQGTMIFLMHCVLNKDVRRRENKYEFDCYHYWI